MGQFSVGDNIYQTTVYAVVRALGVFKECAARTSVVDICLITARAVYFVLGSHVVFNSVDEI